MQSLLSSGHVQQIMSAVTRHFRERSWLWEDTNTSCHFWKNFQKRGKQITISIPYLTSLCGSWCQNMTTAVPSCSFFSPLSTGLERHLHVEKQFTFTLARKNVSHTTVLYSSYYNLHFEIYHLRYIT